MREVAEPASRSLGRRGLLDGVEPSSPRKGPEAGHERALRRGSTARIAASRDASRSGPSSM